MASNEAYDKSCGKKNISITIEVFKLDFAVEYYLLHVKDGKDEFLPNDEFIWFILPRYHIYKTCDEVNLFLNNYYHQNIHE